MTSQTRTLLLLGVMAVGAVVVLGWMAQRYQSILTTAESGDAGRIQQVVDRFVETRRQLIERQDEWQEADALAFAALRTEIQRRVGMDAADYREARLHFRSWLDSGSTDPLWGAAFDAREAQARGASLGDQEERDR